MSRAVTGLHRAAAAIVVVTVLLLLGFVPPAMPGHPAPIPQLAELLTVTIPALPDVPAEIRHATVRAPTLGLAGGLRDGFAVIGKPFVFGGVNDDGCRVAAGRSGTNACQGTAGFDPPGLSHWILERSGVLAIPDDVAGQRSGGQQVSRHSGRPGDLVTYAGTVEIYLGLINGDPYVLTAFPNVHIERATWRANGGPADRSLRRW